MHDPREVLEICEKATDGPWGVKLHNEDYGQGYGETTYYVDLGLELLKVGIADDASKDSKYSALSDFIALARTTLPEFARRVIELEEKWHKFVCEEAEHQEKVCIAECDNQKHGYCYDMQRCDNLQAENEQLRARLQNIEISLDDVPEEALEIMGLSEGVTTDG